MFCFLITLNNSFLAGNLSSEPEFQQESLILDVVLRCTPEKRKDTPKQTEHFTMRRSDKRHPWAAGKWAQPPRAVVAEARQSLRQVPSLGDETKQWLGKYCLRLKLGRSELCEEVV